MHNLISCNFGCNNLNRHIISRNVYVFRNYYCSGRKIKILGVETVIPDHVFIIINHGSAIFNDDLPNEVFIKGTIMGHEISEISFYNKESICINVGTYEDMRDFDIKVDTSSYNDFFKAISSRLTLEFDNNKLKSYYGFYNVAYESEGILEKSASIKYYK